MESLYDAAVKGDTNTMIDPLLLKRVSLTSPNTSPLHIATMYGHLTFVQAILNHSPKDNLLAEKLDSQQSSALHIASAKGYVEIVSELLKSSPNMCFSCDSQGRNPLHLAVVKGHGPVLKELVRVAPVAAREKVDRGVGLLHLCVKHKQLDAMKFLLENFSDMINDRDDDGDTVLHMAVRDNQIEMTAYLLNVNHIDVNAKNSNGQTASDISKQNQNSELTKLFKQAVHSNSTKLGEKETAEKWRDSLMVVAILIATMAFQAMVNPPGGVWPENKLNKENDLIYLAGEAVMGQYHEKIFKIFIWSSTVAFVLSLSTILLLISGLPFKWKVFTWILRVIMWLTISSIGTTYAISIYVVTPNLAASDPVLKYGIVVWCVVMVIPLVGNTLRLLKIHTWLKDTGIKAWQCFTRINDKYVTLGHAHV